MSPDSSFPPNGSLRQRLFAALPDLQNQMYLAALRARQAHAEAESIRHKILLVEAQYRLQCDADQ